MKRKSRKAREFYLVQRGVCGTQIFTSKRQANKYADYSASKLEVIHLKEVLPKKRSNNGR